MLNTLVLASWIVMGTAGETPAHGQGAVAQMKRDMPENVKMAAAFPKVIATSTIKGLKGGRYVAAAGFCDSEEKAKAVRDLLNLSGHGASIKQVDPPRGLEDTCPSIKIEEAKTPPKLRETGSTAIPDTSGAYVKIYTGSPPKKMKGCDRGDLRVRIESGGREIGEAGFAAVCVDFQQKGSEATVIEAGGKVFIAVNTTTWTDDLPEYQWQLYHVACGKLVELEVPFGAGPYAEKIEWSTDVLTIGDSGASDRTQYLWSPEECSFEKLEKKP